MAYRPTEKTRAHMTKQRIKLLNAAKSIVSQEGFNGLTIKKVANHSGLAVGSVYKHYQSKNHLLEQVYCELTEQDLLLDHGQIFTSNDPKEQLTTALEQLFSRALMSDKLSYALFAEPLSESIEQHRLRFKDQFKQIFIQIIDQGIKQSRFLNQESNIVASAIMGTLNEATLIPLRWQHQQMPTFERIKLIQQCQQFCLRSITYSGDEASFFK